MQEIKPKFSLKDQLFNKEKVEYLSWLIKNVYPDFKELEFQMDILEKFPDLELKERINHISNMFKKYLPNDFEKAVNILLKSLPEVIENWEMDNNFWDFIFCPYSDFVAKNWCNKEYLNFSLNTLEKMTCNFSAEDSIRYFLNEFEDETFEKMLEWSKSLNYHHRRLSSEWTRQKLPWCQKINLDYKKTIEILNNLYLDESRYVTRSVANHLNDISKIDPELVIKTLALWQNNNKSKDINYIISHSTRTLVKKWDKNTLELLWYSDNPKIEVLNFNIKNDIVKVWENLEFDFDILFKKQENLILDYRIYFVLKNWKLWEKVFKIKKLKWKKLDKIKVLKKHPLRLMSTKKLFEWIHKIELQINWKNIISDSFKLIY